MKYFITLIILLILNYLCFAFIILDFNPLNWNLDNRTVFVFSILAIIALSLPIYGMCKNMDDF